MKVVQVTTRYPPRVGGVETHVAELSEHLASEGHDVTVHTTDDDTDVPSHETRAGVRVVRHRGVAPSGAFHVAPGVFRAVRRESRQADVVHAHNYHSLPLLFAAVGTGRRAPFVATPHYHGASTSGFRDRLLSLYRPVGGLALERADAVVAVSEWERDLLAADFGVSATVIPNGIDVSAFADAEPVEREQPYLLSIGRIERYKGVQHVVRALLDLPNFELLVGGSGPYRDELEQIAHDIGVADRVEFLGYVEDGALPGYYAGAAAFVTMSVVEAYGITVAEALAAGTPCVVREAGALADWTVREDCVGVGDPTSSDLAAGVKRALELDAPSEPLPQWSDVVAEVERVYMHL